MNARSIARPDPSEHAHTINGVEGRMFARVVRSAERGTFHNQTWKATRPLPSEPRYRVLFEMRFDDACGNGHNTFSITGEVKDSTKRGEAAWVSGGQCTDELREAFPELAHLLKWHLVSTDGPMHYLANTVFHASDRDCWGLLKGERRQRRTRNGSPMWELVVVMNEGSPPALRGRSENDDCDTVPVHRLDTLHTGDKPGVVPILDWRPCYQVGEGKARELDYARSSAVWPEATDEDLTAPGLKERLEARLPQLLGDFRAAVESCGFAWSATP